MNYNSLLPDAKSHTESPPEATATQLVEGTLIDLVDEHDHDPPETQPRPRLHSEGGDDENLYSESERTHLLSPSSLSHMDSMDRESEPLLSYTADVTLSVPGTFIPNRGTLVLACECRANRD